MKTSLIAHLNKVKKDFDKEKDHQEEEAYETLRKLSTQIKQYQNDQMSEVDKKEITAMLDFIVEYKTRL